MDSELNKQMQDASDALNKLLKLRKEGKKASEEYAEAKQTMRCCMSEITAKIKASMKATAKN